MVCQEKIVVIGGGTGTFTVLSGLKKYPVNLSAIVTMADDGGSSGVLRDELGTLPPGDVRQCLVALSRASLLLRKLFKYRFQKGTLKGHNFGNLFITALSQITGNFHKAVEEAGKILAIQGRVIPVTTDLVTLRARLKNGQVISGQANIYNTTLHGRKALVSLSLKPRPKANTEAIMAIKKANKIIIGPGDLYSSLVPNLLVPGIPEAIKKSQAIKIYVCNLMTVPGQTDGFYVEDFVSIMERYLGKEVLDYIIVNTKKPTPAQIRKYAKQGEKFVKLNSLDLPYKIIKADLLKKRFPQRDPADRIKRTLIRHDPSKLSKIIIEKCK